MTFAKTKINLCFVLIFVQTSIMAQTAAVFEKTGNTEFERANYYGAAQMYKKALNLDANNNVLIYKIANAMRLNRDFEQACMYYEKLLYSADKFPELLFWLATCEKSIGRYKKAQQHFIAYTAQNQNANNYYVQKARRESEVCQWLTDSSYILYNDTIEINHLPEKINSKYSELSIFVQSDTVLFFSTYKPWQNNGTYQSVMQQIENENSNWINIETPGNIINIEGKSVSSLFIDDKTNMLFLSVCDYAGTNCRIYSSSKNNGQWGQPTLLPPKINYRGANTTHPVVHTINGIKYLLFASDRYGGNGNFDLWKAEIYTQNQFSEAVKIGDSINTPGNEISPFFDEYTNTLFFSSDWHVSLGGFDIFSAKYDGKYFTSVQNMGKPVNTSYDDFYLAYAPNRERAYFISNRPGSNSFQAATCCNDIYSYLLNKPLPPPVDSIPPVADLPNVPEFTPLTDTIIDMVTLVDTIPTNNLSPYLPRFEVFFDNDQPQPNSFATKTTLSYDTVYHQYINRRNEYRNIFTNGKTGQEYEKAETAIKKLFHGVETGYYNLNKFCQAALYLLKNSYYIEVTIRGSASPLNNARYNLNLSKRRISCVQNYFENYKNGVLKKYIENNQLNIVQIPLGESFAKTAISDNRKDVQNSVYGPEAAKERKVDLVVENIKKK